MQIRTFYKILFLVSFIWLLAFASPKNINLQKTNFDRYILDSVKSKLHWNCAHQGYLKFKEGEILFDGEEPIQANFTVDMASIINTDINNKLLQGTLQNVLKSDVFFDVDKYPTAIFKSDVISRVDSINYDIKGDFILFDAGICTDFKATITIKNDSVYFNTKIITLDRTDWAIFYGSANNPRPREEEEGFRVTDTILLDAHIVAYKIK